MIGQTRVHVDAVEGLGNFMELEVCMEKGQSISEGEKIAQNLMKQLNIQDNDLIVCAYMDLLINKKE
jgi:predicted adenylyl cyclase CyaB